MRARLVALEGQADICLDRPLTLVGRHRGCDVRLNSPQVSRQHCCLAWQDGAIEVRDLGSTNGVKINGCQVESGRLRPGDELSIGRHRYLLTVGQPSSTPPPETTGPRPDSPPELPTVQEGGGQLGTDPVGFLRGDLGSSRLRKA